jgi:uncharacterized protein
VDKPVPGISIVDCPPSEVGLSATDSSSSYVGRAADEQVRKRLRAAAAEGGIVYLVGDPLTGRTRCAFEALREVLPDWRLVTADALDDPDRLPPRTVVWLGDLEGHLAELTMLLTGRDMAGPTTADLRRLIERSEPVVIVATMRADTVRTISALYRDRYDDQRDHTDEVREQRRLVVTRLLAEAGPPVRLDTALDPAERERAELVAGTDPRIAEALADPGHFYARMAGAPRTDSTPLLDAAVDCRRLGYRAPLTEELLRDAVGDDVVVNGAAFVPVPGGFDLHPYVEFQVERRRLVTPVSERVRAAAERHASNPDDLVRLARDAWDHLDERRAERLYRSALTARHPAAARQLCTLLQRRDRHAEALELCRDRAAHADDAGFEWTRWKVPHLLDRLGRTDEAIDAWRELAAVDDQAHRPLVDLLCRLRRTDEALAVFRGAATDEPPHALVEQLREQGRAEEVAALYRTAVETVDARPAPQETPRRSQGDLLRRAGQVDEAIEAYRDAVVREGDRSAAHNLETLLRKAGRVAEYGEVLREAIVAGRYLHTELLRVLIAAGRLDEALDVYVEAAGGCAGEAEMFAQHLEFHGRPDDAVDVLDDAMEYGEPLQLQLGSLLCRLRRYPQAAKNYLYAEPYAVVEQLNDQHEVYEVITAIRQLGLADPGIRDLVDHWLRDLDNAVPDLDSDLEFDTDRPGLWRDSLDPERPATYRGLAGALRDAGRAEEAIDVWRDAIAAGVVGARSSLADLLERLGRHDEAIEESRAALAAGDQWALEKLVYRLRQLGRGTEVFALCHVTEDGRVEAPGVPAHATGDVAVQVAPLLRDAGRVDEAVAVYRRALTDGSHGQYGLFLDLTELLRDTGRDDETIDVWHEEYVRRLRKAHRDKRSWQEVELRDAYDALQSLTELLEHGGRAEEAVALWRDALAEDPTHESVYESLAGLLRRLSRPAEVVATYRVAWVGGSTRARKRQRVIRRPQMDS